MRNYFHFQRFDEESVLITNDFGRYLFLSNDEFRLFVCGQIALSSELEQKLRERLFLLDEMQLYSLDVAKSLQDMKCYLFSPTTLHIFVVTNVCNFRCVYCQAQTQQQHSNGFMSFEIGKRAIDIALQSPAHQLTFEFQGGEPLMNFPVIRQMIEYTEAVCGDKQITFSLVSNLSLATKEILDFLTAHQVMLSTSLDGPQDLQDVNRKMCTGASSYAHILEKLCLLQSVSGSAGAIQTTTRASLSRAREIVQEYAALHMKGIFLRPLTPLGFAKDDWAEVGYTPEEFLEFYQKAFEEILQINRNGTWFPEQHAQYFLRKILGGFAFNYMELRSPCGAGIGQMAYYYDGKVYTCDEARMVAESGDELFCLGDVFTGDYQSLVSSETCKATCAASVMESLPGCCDCVYQPYCGVCPVINYALEGDVFAKQAHGYRCQIYGGILHYLFSLLKQADAQTIDILYSWIEEETP